jgi:hypothetical protein
MEVNTMVVMDVAMAILTHKSVLTLCKPMKKVRKGTMIMPPPMPKRPARKPVTNPRQAKAKSSGRGRSIMREFE